MAWGLDRANRGGVFAGVWIGRIGAVYLPASGFGRIGAGYSLESGSGGSERCVCRRLDSGGSGWCICSVRPLLTLLLQK